MSLGDHKGKRNKGFAKSYVVFDLETTGISPHYDQVVEISALKVENGQVMGEFSTLVNPGRRIPAAASEVNGITDDMVADAPPMEEALKGFLEFIGDMILVGHNIQSFDLKFIERDAQRYFGKTLENDFIDTLILARTYLAELPSHALTNLARYYRINTDGAHRALADCRMTQKVYVKLSEEMQKPEKAGMQPKVCPLCGNVLAKRSGRYGEFWGCCGYPDCRYTEKYKA